MAKYKKNTHTLLACLKIKHTVVLDTKWRAMRMRQPQRERPISLMSVWVFVCEWSLEETSLTFICIHIRPKNWSRPLVYHRVRMIKQNTKYITTTMQYRIRFCVCDVTNCISFTHSLMSCYKKRGGSPYTNPKVSGMMFWEANEFWHYWIS